MSLLSRERVSDDATRTWIKTNKYRDGNIRYFEYENDKFEFLSEYKSGDPQRGIAFVPRRGINVGLILNLPKITLIRRRFMRMR